jgi:hypothetical protein
MRKLLALLSAAAMLIALLSANALAWDNCGHGMHRWQGHCVSNYVHTGCGPGYHLGWNVRRCIPN